MRNLLCIWTILAGLLSTDSSFARIVVSDSTRKPLPPIRRFYVGSALDGAIISTATVQRYQAGTVYTGATNYATPRLSLFFNMGTTFQYNPARHIGFYTGIDLKNIGFIEQSYSGATVKRRSYNLGVPLAIKIGNMVVQKPFVFLGGGLDFPINFKEKTFTIRDQKVKISEWFSSRTPTLMPYVFAGASVYKGLTVKFQYYPSNFLNPEFTENGVKPYQGYQVHLLLCSIGYAMALSKEKEKMPLPAL